MPPPIQALSVRVSHGIPPASSYAQYFSDIIEHSLQPTVRPLRIRGITLVTIPRFGLGFAGQGVCPLFEVWDVTAAAKKRLLYTSERPDTEPRCARTHTTHTD